MDRGRVERLVPGVGAIRGYQRAGLGADLVAGLAGVALAIPAGMGYATAAGLPPVTGLYATIVPLLAYAVFGPSRVLVLGPDSSLAPMIAAAVLPLALGSADRAVALAGTLALLMGVMLIAGRVLRLGFVTGLLSQPIRVGYLNGVALVVIVSQLPALLGLSVPGGSLWERLAQTAQGIADGAANGLAAGVGLGSLVVMVLARVLRSKVPGVVLAVVVSMTVTAVLGLADRLPVVGVLPQGLPAPALTGVQPSDVLALLGPALGIARKGGMGLVTNAGADSDLIYRLGNRIERGIGRQYLAGCIVIRDAGHSRCSQRNERIRPLQIVILQRWFI